MCATITTGENVVHWIIMKDIIGSGYAYKNPKSWVNFLDEKLVNVKDEEDNTVLMSVVRLKAMDIVGQLKMPYFADTIRLLKKHHLRDVVVNESDAEVVIAKLLIYAKKEDVKDGHKDVIRALVLAKSRILKIVKLLLAHPYIKVDAKNCYGETPLMLAAANGDLRAVKSLLGSYPDKGKNVNETNNRGSTALVMAVVPKKCDTDKALHLRRMSSKDADEIRFDLVKLLLSHPDTKDVDDKALHWARKLGYKEIEVLLTNHKKRK